MTNSTTTEKNSAKSTSKDTNKSHTDKKSTSASSEKSKEATQLLRADHRKVEKLFSDYENAKSLIQKKRIVTEICTELTVHAQIEEEIFYPAVKKALKDKELVPEATVEHDTLRNLIAQIEGVEPSGEMFDAKVKVLSEYVNHHVKEEQNEIFPKAEKEKKLDLRDLGAQLTQRKEELLGETR